MRRMSGHAMPVNKCVKVVEDSESTFKSAKAVSRSGSDPSDEEWTDEDMDDDDGEGNGSDDGDLGPEDGEVEDVGEFTAEGSAEL